MPRWPSTSSRLEPPPTAEAERVGPAELPAGAGPVLLALARSAIARELGLPGDARAEGTDAAWLRRPGACFVTLRTAGALHGCVGSLEAHRPLGDDVRANARAAAFADRRFPALTRHELGTTTVEVSVLSPTETLPHAGEADARARLRPKVDGVVFACGGRRSTLLPQVWDTLATPAAFLDHLKVKAGFPADFWSDTVTLARYTVTEFHESAGQGR